MPFMPTSWNGVSSLTRRFSKRRPPSRRNLSRTHQPFSSDFSPSDLPGSAAKKVTGAPVSRMKLKGPLLLIFALTIKWLDLLMRKGILIGNAWSAASMLKIGIRAIKKAIQALRMKSIRELLSSNYLIGE